MRLDPAAAVTICLALLSAALSYGGSVVRDAYQDRDIAGLHRALELERAERLAYQSQEAQRRVAWLLRRPGSRLDPSLLDAAR